MKKSRCAKYDRELKDDLLDINPYLLLYDYDPYILIKSLSRSWVWVDSSGDFTQQSAHFFLKNFLSEKVPYFKEFYTAISGAERRHLTLRIAISASDFVRSKNT